MTIQPDRGNWKPGFRHQVAWDVIHTRTQGFAGWRCIDCGQWFERWPSDDQACPGPAPPPESREGAVMRPGIPSAVRRSDADAAQPGAEVAPQGVGEGASSSGGVESSAPGLICVLCGRPDDAHMFQELLLCLYIDQGMTPEKAQRVLNNLIAEVADE